MCTAILWSRWDGGDSLCVIDKDTEIWEKDPVGTKIKKFFFNFNCSVLMRKQQRELDSLQCVPIKWTLNDALMQEFK